MYRKAGAIPPITKEKYPSRLVIFDTEAIREGYIEGKENQTLRFGVLRSLILSQDLQVEQGEYYTFSTCEALYSYIEWFTRKDKTTYVYAHNIKYDLQLTGLLKLMIMEGWDISLFVMDDPPTFIRLKKNRKVIMFVDTFNYWQTSVAKMGKQLGLDKLPMPDNSANNATWEEYCKRDVDVLSEYLLSFMRFTLDNDLCGLGLTLASQSFRTYRHRFMNNEIILHNDEKVTKLERNAYSGGKVEAYFIGFLGYKTYYKLDVNSMYPFVMKSYDYPVELVSYADNVPLERLPDLLKEYYCIAECELETTDNPYPYRDNHKLIFPIGIFSTYLQHQELLYAYFHNHIRQIKQIAIYRKADIFTGFVDYFYNIKQEAEKQDNEVLRFQAKILLNSLYGKFGQREVISKIIENTGEPKIARFIGYSESLGKSVVTTYLGSNIEIRYAGGESTYSFPAIAGAVTAYARMYLYSLAEIAGFANVFYCDTDSLIVNLEGLNNLSEHIDNSKIGYLKIEDSTNEVMIRGCKDYTFGEENKMKGVPKSAIPLSLKKWQYEQFRGGKTWLNENMPIGVEVTQRVKERKSTYDKGIISFSGRVNPWFLNGGNSSGNVDQRDI